MNSRLLYLPELAGDMPNACSYLRMIAPLAKLATQKNIMIEKLTSLQQFNSSDVIALSTNRTAFLDFPGLQDLIAKGSLKSIQLHWDTDDFTKIMDPFEIEIDYLQKLAKAQSFMEEHANLITTSTDYIKMNSSLPKKWKVVRNSIPDNTWNNSLKKDSESLLFFGTKVHSGEILRLSEAFDNLNLRKLIKSKISIEVIGDFNLKLNPIFKITKVPKDLVYYPRFANWLSVRSTQSLGLALIQDSILNRGKSALKFMEYAAMGMGTIGYSHEALDADPISQDNYIKIRRNNPAEDILNVQENYQSNLVSIKSSINDVKAARVLSLDKKGMYHFYNEFTR